MVGPWRHQFPEASGRAPGTSLKVVGVSRGRSGNETPVDSLMFDVIMPILQNTAIELPFIRRIVQMMPNNAT